MSSQMRNPQAVSKEDVKTAKAPEYNWRVLVVEDEPAIAEGIKAILVPSGAKVIPFPQSSRSQQKITNTHHDFFNVTVAHNPHEALKLIKEAHERGQPFAMGFFDVLLKADIDGIELVRRAFEVDSKIHAVFVTAYHDRSVDSINQILGPNKSDQWDYINKPFSDGEILQKARNVVTLWNLRETKEWQEAQLAEAHRLLLMGERANTVAAFGRSVAHEFGNLLTQIVGHAELSLMSTQYDRMKTALETILKATETATSVLERFKKVAHNGYVNPDKNLIVINSAIDEALELMSYQFKKYRVHIQKHKYYQVPLEGNHHSLVQVFMNLFINAVHVMPNGGQIDISVIKQEDDSVIISIRDHGTGIPEDILPKVTEPLFTTKGSGGTGLGLSICKEIIEIEHAGEFKIQNHEIKGAEVVMKLPLRQGTME